MTRQDTIRNASAPVALPQSLGSAAAESSAGCALSGGPGSPAAPAAAATVPSVEAAATPPLVVDLDGTLVATNLLLEAALMLVKDRPSELLRLPLWWLRGRAAVKREIWARARLDVGSLPYREPLGTYLRAEARGGRRLILATANDRAIATQVAHHLGLFDGIIASDGPADLDGRRKRDRLVDEFGAKGFDYVADRRADLEVWAAARRAIVVGSRGLAAAAARRTAVERVFEKPGLVRPALRALRAHHWLKNLLIFAPLLGAHRLEEPALVAMSLVAFASFCLLASGLYVFNDLLDLESDRRHPRKSLRPIPAGELPLGFALGMVPLLLAGGLGVATRLPRDFLVLSALYCGLTLAYSLRLKQIVLLDVIVLASLYVLRVVAGGAAGHTPVSRWLLSLSMFTFLSLALLKRHTEIVARAAVEGPVRVRGYEASDATLLMAAGVASGYLAAAVLALYLDTPAALRYYGQREVLWLACPVFLYWISFLWLMAGRNRMLFDPVVFAVGNRTSQVLLLLMLGLYVLAF